MTDALATYLHDHLAGARFAVTLLQDLSKQSIDTNVSQFATKLLTEIESDRLVLEEFVKQTVGEASSLKEATAWIAQRAGRLKLTLSEPFGIFEAIEMLALGVLGKLALWNSLERLQQTVALPKSLEYMKLMARARDQHDQLEALRLTLAAKVLRQSRSSPVAN